MKILLQGFCLFSTLFIPILVPAQDFFDWNAIHEIRITFQDPQWDQTLDAFKQGGVKSRLEAEVEINGKKYPQVGVRYKGNSSYFNVRKTGSTKLPFNLKSDFVRSGQVFPGNVTTLKLSNVFRDPSFLREVLSYEIARKYMPAPRANFVKLYINGEYLGLYNSTESIDDDFCMAHFGDNKGLMIKCDPEEWGAELKEDCPPGDKASLMYMGEDLDCYRPFYELKLDSGWNHLVQLTQILNQEPERIEEVLDVDRTLWMLAFNIVLLNLDSYTGRLSHNYYLYQRQNGVFTPLIWDLNLSMGGFRYADATRVLGKEELQQLSPFIYYKDKDPKRPLITQLLSNTLYRKIYLAHIRTILEENIANGEYLKRSREIQAFIEKEVAADNNKLYDFEGFQTNLQSSAFAGKTEIFGIAELMEGRANYLQNHPVFKTPPPVFEEVSHHKYGPTMAINAKVKGGALRVLLMYRLNAEDRFTQMEMFDDGGHNDATPGDGIWGATIDWAKGIQYYVIAEGERSARLSPERASHEFHVVK